MKSVFPVLHISIVHFSLGSKIFHYFITIHVVCRALPRPFVELREDREI